MWLDFSAVFTRWQGLGSTPAIWRVAGSCGSRTDGRRWHLEVSGASQPPHHGWDSIQPICDLCFWSVGLSELRFTQLFAASLFLLRLPWVWGTFIDGVPFSSSTQPRTCCSIHALLIPNGDEKNGRGRWRLWVPALAPLCRVWAGGRFLSTVSECRVSFFEALVVTLEVCRESGRGRRVPLGQERRRAADTANL